MSEDRRLDIALVSSGLARSRGQAKDLIGRGLVTVDGATATKVSQRVGAAAVISVAGDDARWVSRAAHKLVGAFETFGPTGWEVDGRRCLDLGACTGGFTQVLLDRGASEVLALDVGHDQLAAELRRDPRVRDLSGVTARGLTPDDIAGAVDRVVGDLSFISLRLVLPAVRSCLEADGQAVLLVKPQFEVGRALLGKHGVVTDPRARSEAVLAVLSTACELDLGVLGLARSPISGSEGNLEYLLWLSRDAGVGMSWQALTSTVEQLSSEEVGA